MLTAEPVNAQDTLKDSEPKVHVTAFARYAFIGNAVKDIPTMHANLAGVEVSYKRLAVEVSYLRNHTLQRNGVVIATTVGIFKKPLGKGFGFGSKAILEAAFLPSQKVKDISFQSLGAGVSFKKTFAKKFSCSVAIPLLVRRLKLEDLPSRYLFEYRVVIGLNYKF